jgi:hypothetical protein
VGVAGALAGVPGAGGLECDNGKVAGVRRVKTERVAWRGGGENRFSLGSQVDGGGGCSWTETMTRGPACRWLGAEEVVVQLTSRVGFGFSRRRGPTTC